MHVYDEKFFDWVDSGARRSARVLLPLVQKQVNVRSVLDVGCGRGTWLGVWNELGVLDFVGVDGEYVSVERLAIPRERFIAADLSRKLPLSRRFDLVQSLEVAEHLPSEVSAPLIKNLCLMADVVIFSAAQPGQGGELHVNERTPEFWANLFLDNGFARFDSLRPVLAYDKRIEPWYRFNTFIYANTDGQRRLARDVLDTKIPPGERAPEFGHLTWKIRKRILRRLSVPMVTGLARVNYRVRTLWRSIHTGQ